MILMHVTYRVKPGKREAFLQAIREAHIDEASKNEAGNRQYDYYLSVDSAENVLLIEEWENAVVLAAHKTTPHFQKLADIKEQYVEQTFVQKYSFE